MAKPARRLIDHFMNGRAVLGKALSPAAPTYAWLTNAEVVSRASGRSERRRASTTGVVAEAGEALELAQVPQRRV